MHTNTDKRWDQVQELRPFVLETLPYKSIDRSIYNNKRDVIIKNEAFDEYENPIDIMARKVISSMSNYNNSFTTVPDIEYLSKRLPSFKQNNSLF